MFQELTHQDQNDTAATEFSLAQKGLEKSCRRTFLPFFYHFSTWFYLHMRKRQNQSPSILAWTNHLVDSKLSAASFHFSFSDSLNI